MWDAKNTKKALEHRWTWRPPGWRDMVGWGVTVRTIENQCLGTRTKSEGWKDDKLFLVDRSVFFLNFRFYLSFLGVATCWGWWKTPLSMNVRFTYAWSFFIFAGCQADVYPFCSHNHVRFTNHPCHISYVPFGQAFLPPQRASLKNVICTPESSHDWPGKYHFSI